MRSSPAPFQKAILRSVPVLAAWRRERQFGLLDRLCEAPSGRFEVADRERERIVDLVRHSGHELAKRRHLRRLNELGLRGLQVCIGLGDLAAPVVEL